MIRTTLGRAAVIALCVVLAWAPRPAAADDAATHTAKTHFARGEKLFALGKFDTALAEYQRAFDAKPIPAFLFNIGQCYRNLGDFGQAIFSFQKYLELAPEAENRDSVQALIDDLQVKQDRLAAQRPPPARPHEPATDGAPPPEGHHAFYTRWWFWTGVAALALVGGGIGVYEGTRDTTPSTTLGNIVFGK